MKLDFKQYGDAGPPLCLLHGLLGSRQNWHSLAQALSKTFRVIVPSLRNHGDSPHAGHSLTAMVHDIIELLDSIGLARAHVLGHSMGGMVAMRMAIGSPERLHSVIVEDIGPESRLDQTQGIFQALLSLDLTSIRNRDDASRHLTPEIPDAAVRQFLLQNLTRTVSGSYRWRCNLDELYRFTQTQTRIFLDDGVTYEGPTLFIAGARSDHNVTGQSGRIREHFPKAEIQIVADAAHWVHFDNPGNFLRLVQEFLAKQGR